ncbi:hypothetical protein V0U79_09415 [Hyphobacterium sp. HN65]|uniref:Uncharacterized protein n=1 Tax=Hyphobacterium lacteum TaxID=3116575 RepID=A0ABU7LRP5_9PROT|nr:hypothetical protein [Hyphobacterium sp. HN65]MEE2526585.1 hypothetical protein [Hyphobacterium sp. HN65]
MTDSNEPEPVDAEFEPADDGPAEAAPRRKAGVGGHVLTFLIAAVIGGGIGGSIAWMLDRTNTDAVDLSGVESRIAALEAAPEPAMFDPSGLEQRVSRLEAAETPAPDLSDIEARLEALEAAEPTAGDPTIPVRVIALESRVGEIEALANQALDQIGELPGGMDPAAVSALQERLDILEATPAQSSGIDLTPLEARIAALETAAAPEAFDPAALEERLTVLETAEAPATDLSSIEARLDALESQSANASQPGSTAATRAQRLAARTLGLLALTEIARTSQPFEAERAALTRSWSGRSELETLAAYARSGVADSNHLANSFPRESIEATIGTRRVFFGLIELRPSAGSESSPLARVMLIDERLNEGDLAGAVSLATELEGEALTAAQPWLVQAQARLAVDEALSGLRSALVEAAANEGGDPT